MADADIEIRTFLRHLPGDIELARRSIVSADINLLEHWHMRMENAINLLRLLQDRFQTFQQNVVVDSLEALLQEAQIVSQSIGNRIVEPILQHSIMTETEISVMGRPRKSLSREDIENQFAIFRNWKVVAHQLGVSTKTIRRRRFEFGMDVSCSDGTRITYSDISQENLCIEIRNVLNTLPDAGETIVIGALRSRLIHVQRRRVRQAINDVDPVGRALRRTVSIIRRVYNVPSPNSLW